MATGDYLIRATAGLADMDRGLAAAYTGARVVAGDEDLPMDARPKVREAVKAIEHAKKKVAEAVMDVAAARKVMGVPGAS